MTLALADVISKIVFWVGCCQALPKLNYLATSLTAYLLFKF